MLLIFNLNLFRLVSSGSHGLTSIFVRQFSVSLILFDDKKDDDALRINYYASTKDGKKVSGVSIGTYDYDRKKHVRPMDAFDEIEAKKIKKSIKDNINQLDPHDQYLYKHGQKGDRAYDDSHHFTTVDGFDQLKEKISITEGQQFIRVSKALKISKAKWVQTSLPSIHARSFVFSLAQTIAELKPGTAYAAHFVAGGPINTYISLGPSFVVTNSSDPYEILTHIKELARYYEESYDIKLDNYTFIRLRDLGGADDLVKTVYRKLTDIKHLSGPWGTVKASANLPFPNFDFLKMLNSYQSELDSYSDREVALRHLHSFSLNGIRLNVLTKDKIVFTLPTGGEIQYNITSDAPYGTSFENPEGVDYRYTKGFYVNTSEEVYIPFNDIELDDYLISRNVRGINMHIDRNTGDVVGYDHAFGPRRFISTAPPSANFSGHKIVTADIEALIHNRKDNIPYAAAYYTLDDKERPIYRCFKWQDYNLDSDLLLKAFWKELANHAVGKTVYFHNWNGYDAFLALNPLVLLAQERGWFLRPILRNGKIINLKVYSGKFNKGKEILLFDIKDSILLLPGGLGSLAKSFKLPVLKEHFPHYFDVLNFAHDANYIGPWPEYSCFESKRTSMDDYLNIIQQNPVFDFMAHTMKYLHLDVLLLHQILSKFLVELHDEFKVDARKNMSIPGVAFKTWKIHQLPILEKSGKNHNILDFSEKYDEFFREAYLGGIVDVYKPRVTDGFYYDVNSLYPTAMLSDLPVGQPIFQTFTVKNFLETDWFGFIHATVKAPDNIIIPILAIRREGKLISPTGTFTGTWFSEEVRFALDNGYTLISIGYGYKFNKSNKVFDQFIHNLSQMKINAEKSGLPAKRNIAKLLMNSTYGRFGMHDNNTVSTIVPEKDAITILRGFNVVRSIPFTNGYELLEYDPIPDTNSIQAGLVTLDDVKKFSFLKSGNSETNVPLAAAITAHSRMIINKYKVDSIKLGIDVIYSDTDSLIVNKRLPDSWLHPTEFGKFKLEHVIKEGYFIAPKLYYLDAIDQKTGETYSVSKSRGYNGTLDLAQIKRLYSGEEIDLKTTKWYRSWKEHRVYFNMDSPLTITGKFTKRTKVYDLEGKWVSTKALVYNDPPVPIMTINPVEFNKVDRDTGYFWNIQRTLMYRNPNRPFRRPSDFTGSK